jgi:hypothetical protein
MDGSRLVVVLSHLGIVPLEILLEPYIAAHNMILSHANAVSIYRNNYQVQIRLLLDEKREDYPVSFPYKVVS